MCGIAMMLTFRALVHKSLGAPEVRDHCAIIHTHAMIYDIMCAVRTQ